MRPLQWYTKSEQITRTAIWVSSNGFAQILGGVIAYGIAQGGNAGRYDISPWRLVFVLFGCLTVSVGIFALFFLPDNQLNAWWLPRDQRQLAVVRVRGNQQGIGSRKFKLHQFKEVFTDPFSWLLFLFAVAANIPNGGLTNFFSQLVVSFGFTPEQSLLHGTPTGAVGIIVILVWGVLSQRYACRIIGGIICLLTAMIGVILMVVLPLSNPVGRLVGYYLTMTIPAGEAAVLSLIASNVAG